MSRNRRTVTHPLRNATLEICVYICVASSDHASDSCIVNPFEVPFLCHRRVLVNLGLSHEHFHHGHCVSAHTCTLMPLPLCRARPVIPEGFLVGRAGAQNHVTLKGRPSSPVSVNSPLNPANVLKVGTPSSKGIRRRCKNHEGESPPPRVY